MFPERNDNGDQKINEDLRDEAIDTTLNRIDRINEIPEKDRNTALAIGNRSLSQFLGIYEPSLKNQLREQAEFEQNIMTKRYVDFLGKSGSLIAAGNDLASCLKDGLDYDLKLARMAAPSLGMHAAPNLTFGAPGSGGGFLKPLNRGNTVPPKDIPDNSEKDNSNKDKSDKK